ncbi:MAG: NAD(P)H-hydrate dehydratase [Verrucomicrobiae bacterium]|nr:NAD(P)H-hydrate dehydratase [Verrucomicrobiae bacterium]
MKIISVAQMRSLEKAALKAGIHEEGLILAAAKGIADYLLVHFEQAEAFWFFCGKGNNGADGLWASRYLAEKKKKVRCFSPYSLNEPDVEPIEKCEVPLSRRIVMVDALLGIGAQGKLKDEIRFVTKSFLQAGRNSVVAIDVPTGVSADTGEIQENAVKADITLCCGFPKLGLFHEETQDFVGRVEVVPLPIPHDACDALKADIYFFDRAEACQRIPYRKWSSHKGSCGHVHLVAGKMGTAGAAILATEGALASGTGLVTVHVPKTIYEVVASSVAEALVRPFEKVEESLLEFSEHAVIVAGPGLGVTQEVEDFLLRLLTDRSRRVVLDADALTVLANSQTLLGLLHEKVLLTPHPGEMKRLLGGRTFARSDALKDFLRRYPCAVLLKGAGTLVGQRDQEISINSTGNPGMATGGMGDVLAGLCGGLIAQGLDVCAAGRLAAWWHGAAADEALAKQSYETLLPRHVIDYLGRAMRKLRNS